MHTRHFHGVKQNVSCPDIFGSLNPGDGNNLVLKLLPFRWLNILFDSNSLHHLSYMYIIRYDMVPKRYMEFLPLIFSSLFYSF